MSPAFSDLPPEVQREVQALRGHWIWLLVLGAAFVVLGAAAMIVAPFVSVASVVFLGILLVMGGVFQIVSAFSAPRWGGFSLHLLTGVLYAVAGVMMVEAPLEGTVGVTLLLAFFFVFSGILRVVAALSLKFHDWGWALASGLVTLTLGLVVWSHLPEAALWLLGIYVGVDMVFYGAAWIVFGLMLRRIPQKTN